MFGLLIGGLLITSLAHASAASASLAPFPSVILPPPTVSCGCGAGQPVEPPVLGVELGHASSSSAILTQPDIADVVFNAHGSSTTPWAVAFTSAGVFVGAAALQHLASHPQETTLLTGINHLIGREFTDSDAQAEMRRAQAHQYYRPSSGGDGIVQSVNDDAQSTFFRFIDIDEEIVVEVTNVGGVNDMQPERCDGEGSDCVGPPRVDHYTVSDLVSRLIAQHKADAEAMLRRPVNSAILSVPPSFGDRERVAVRGAARAVGLEVLRLVSAPLCALSAFGVGSDVDDERNYVVVRVDAEVVEVSVVNVDTMFFETLATKLLRTPGGGCRSGGGISFADGEATPGSQGVCGREGRPDLAVAEVDEVVSGVQVILKGVMRDAARELKEELIVAGVVLVGDSPHIQHVHALVEEYFGRPPLPARVPPEAAVSVGAALRASHLLRKDGCSESCLCDTTALSVGIETAGGLMTTIIPRGVVVPVRVTQLFTTVDSVGALSVRVYEGEHLYASDNALVGVVNVSGLVDAPRGVARVEVEVEVDVNSFVSVTVRELLTPCLRGGLFKIPSTLSSSGDGVVVGASASITMEEVAAHMLSFDDVARAVAAAEARRAVDEELRRPVEARVQLGVLAHHLRLQLNGFERDQTKCAVIGDDDDEGDRWGRMREEVETVVVALEGSEDVPVDVVERQLEVLERLVENDWEGHM